MARPIGMTMKAGPGRKRSATPASRINPPAMPMMTLRRLGESSSRRSACLNRDEKSPGAVEFMSQLSRRSGVGEMGRNRKSVRASQGSYTEPNVWIASGFSAAHSNFAFRRIARRSLRSLINPCANESYLFRCQRLGRRTHWSAGAATRGGLIRSSF